MNESDGIEPRKIFVGGISWETSKDSLKQYFEKFGEVTDCVIMEDPVSKNPRGFGFVTFKSPESVQAVINHPTAHKLDSKKIDPKQAILKGAGPVACKKVFVGGLSLDTTEEDLKAHFSTYGNVVDAEIKLDRNTSKNRGFGFVDFESEDVAKEACRTQYHNIKGKAVEVKKAEPQKKDGREMCAQGYQQGFPYQTAGRGYGQTPVSYYQGQPGYPPNFSYSSPPNYTQPPTQYHYHQPTEYSGMQPAAYGRGFTSQQPLQMSSYHDSGYSQGRSSYGQADNYGAGSYSFDQHSSYNYPESMGSGGSGYGRGNSQRSGYASYGGR